MSPTSSLASLAAVIKTQTFQNTSSHGWYVPTYCAKVLTCFQVYGLRPAALVELPPGRYAKSKSAGSDV